MNILNCNDNINRFGKAFFVGTVFALISIVWTSHEVYQVTLDGDLLSIPGDMYPEVKSTSNGKFAVRELRYEETLAYVWFLFGTSLTLIFLRKENIV